MSENYGSGPGGTSGAADGSSGTVDTAKHEAAGVADTATHEARHVAETAKSEAADVAGEAKDQVRELYAQAQSELKQQAGAQQQRVADGLRSVGEELGSMAERSDSQGLAADIVRQASTRVDDVASWLGQRDPGSLLREVKGFARRKPGVFIGVAALVGLAAGRLTRALAETAADPSGSRPPAGASTATSPRPVTTTAAPVPSGATDGAGAADPLGTPLYDQSRAAWDDTRVGDGGSDDRRDSV